MITITAWKGEASDLYATPKSQIFDIEHRTSVITAYQLDDTPTIGSRLDYHRAEATIGTYLLAEEDLDTLLPSLPTFADLSIVQVGADPLPTATRMLVNIRKARIYDTTYNGSPATKLVMYPVEGTINPIVLITTDTINPLVLAACAT